MTDGEVIVKGDSSAAEKNFKTTPGGLTYMRDERAATRRLVADLVISSA